MEPCSCQTTFVSRRQARDETARDHWAPDGRARGRSHARLHRRRPVGPGLGHGAQHRNGDADLLRKVGGPGRTAPLPPRRSAEVPIRGWLLHGGARRWCREQHRRILGRRPRIRRSAPQGVRGGCRRPGIQASRRRAHRAGRVPEHPGSRTACAPQRMPGAGGERGHRRTGGRRSVHSGLLPRVQVQHAGHRQGRTETRRRSRHGGRRYCFTGLGGPSGKK